MWTTNKRWVVLLWHTILALLMMQLCRSVYFYYNYSLFSEIGVGQLLRLMQGGLLLDMMAVAYGFLLYYIMVGVGQFLPSRVEEYGWYRGVRHAAYFVPYVLFTFANISDAGYYPFVYRRINRDVFSEFEGANFGSLYGEFIVDYWPLTVAFALIILLGVFGYRMVRFERKPIGDTLSWRDGLLPLILVIVLLPFWYLGGKSFSDLMALSARYMSDFKQFPIVLNSPVTILKDGSERQEYSFFSEAELSRHFTPYYKAAPLSDSDTLFGSMRGRNVVIIQMESMAKEFVGFFNKETSSGHSLTPFLDRLLPETLYAQYGFASGKRSIDSFPAIYISMPTFGATFNNRSRLERDFEHYTSYDTGLPRSLKESGYDLKFYHGDREGMMGFFEMLERVGVEKQYTAESYDKEYTDAANDRIGMAGSAVHDLPFGLAMAKDIETLKQPFGAFYFSLSNHNPFVLPDEFEEKFEGGSLPIHRTVQYADFALEKFFERVKEEPWYQNTLFVLTSDHTSVSDEPLYQCLPGKSAVPIAFFDPQGKLKGCVDEYVVQHTDILPTLLYLLGITDPVLSYGANIFDKKAEHIGLNFYYNQYLLFAKEVTVAMTPYGEVRVEAPVVYLQTEPGDDVMPNDSIVAHYTHLLQAIVQDYNHRVHRTSFSIKDVVPKESDQ